MSLNCKVEGYTPPTITWTPCNAQNACDQSVLNISKVVEDFVYVCKAKNSLGFDCASTKLCKSICLLKCFTYIILISLYYYMVEPKHPSDRLFRILKKKHFFTKPCKIVSVC